MLSEIAVKCEECTEQGGLELEYGGFRHFFCEVHYPNKCEECDEPGIIEDFDGREIVHHHCLGHYSGMLCERCEEQPYSEEVISITFAEGGDESLQCDDCFLHSFYGRCPCPSCQLRMGECETCQSKLTHEEQVRQWGSFQKECDLCQKDSKEAEYRYVQDSLIPVATYKTPRMARNANTRA